MISKTFTNMVTNVSSEVQDSTSAMQVLIKNYINRRYFQVLRKFNWRNIDTEYTITTVAGTKDYALPGDFKKPVKVRDTTNGKDIPEILLEDMGRYYSNTLGTEGNISNYAMLEDVVQVQPTSASQISVVSSSASDTTQTVTIRGISNNVEVSETLTVNGTSTQTTAGSYTKITGISKDTDSVGFITCTAGASNLALLAQKQTTSYYKKLRLYSIPSTAIVLSVPYITNPARLIEDGDYPITDICDLIEIGAMADAWREKRQFQKAQVFEMLFEKNIEEYIWDDENSANRVTQFKPATFNRDDLV